MTRPTREEQMTRTVELMQKVWLREMIPPTLMRIFRFLEMAEEELAEAGVPRASGCPVFDACQPNELWHHIENEDIYRAHARQLINRWRVFREDEKELRKQLRHATNIECALALLRTSHAAPLNQSAIAALALAVKDTPLEQFAGDWRERWTGQGLESLEEVRRKLNGLR